MACFSRKSLHLAKNKQSDKNILLISSGTAIRGSGRNANDFTEWLVSICVKLLAVSSLWHVFLFFFVAPKTHFRDKGQVQCTQGIWFDAKNAKQKADACMFLKGEGGVLIRAKPSSVFQCVNVNVVLGALHWQVCSERSPWLILKPNRSLKSFEVVVEVFEVRYFCRYSEGDRYKWETILKLVVH